MSSLHELLAVKKDAAQRGNEISGETKKVFGAKHLFAGSLKTYSPFNEEDTVRFADEHDTVHLTGGIDSLDVLAHFHGRSFYQPEYDIGNLADINLKEQRALGAGACERGHFKRFI